MQRILKNFQMLRFLENNARLFCFELGAVGTPTILGLIRVMNSICRLNEMNCLKKKKSSFR